MPRLRAIIKLKKYCPARCSGSETVPRKLTDLEIDRVKREIEAKSFQPLPDPGRDEVFYKCGYCHAVWKASSTDATNPRRRNVLGKLNGEWQPCTSTPPL
jgi:hypothetical protein